MEARKRKNKNGAKYWEDERNIYQRPEELKNERTEMNNTLEGISSRISEAEEHINGLEDGMVEISATEQNIEKKNEKKWRQPKRPLGQH